MSNTWVNDLIAKHAKNGVLLDSNMLLVYFVGAIDQSLISKVKGTREYSPRDFILLARIVSQFSRIVTTPNVMTEVSNLAGKIQSDIRLLCYRMIRDRFLEVLDERYITTNEASKGIIFERLGVTDASISVLAEQGLLTITNDLDLSLMLRAAELDCIHYDRDLRPIVLAEA